MPLLLHTVRHNRWIRSEADPWLLKGDVPADPIGDLRTSENKLSVWEVSADRSNIERIVRAIAAGKERIDHQGYVLFDSALLSPLGTALQRVPGATHDKAANDWHCDLSELSGNRLVSLTRLILENGETGVVLKKRLEQLFREGIAQHELDLPDGIRTRLLGAD